MPESCTNNPMECPCLARIEALEEGQKREEEFRRGYYEDQRIRIDRDARWDEKMTAMNEKLDKLVSWQETQQARPGKRWDGLVEKAIWAVAAAVIAFLLGRVGL